MSVPDFEKVIKDIGRSTMKMANEAKDGYLKEAAEKEVAEKTTKLAEEILTHTCSEITKQIGGKDGMIHEITKSIITDLREYLKTNDFSFKFIEVLQKKLLKVKKITDPFLKTLVSSFNTIIDQSKEKWLERESSDNKTAPIVGGNKYSVNNSSNTSTDRELGMDPRATTATRMKGTSPYLNGTENEGEDDTKWTENEVEYDTKGTENKVEDDTKGTENNTNDTIYSPNFRNSPISPQHYNSIGMFDDGPKKRMGENGISTSSIPTRLNDAYQDPPPEPKSEEPINDEDDVKTLTQQLVDGLKEKIMEKEKNIVDHIKDVAQKTLIEKIYSDKFSFDFVEVLQTKLLNDSTQEEVLVDKFHDVYNAIMIKVVGEFNSKDSNNSNNSNNSNTNPMYDPNVPYRELKLMKSNVKELQEQNYELQQQNDELQQQINEMKEKYRLSELEGGGKSKKPKKPKKTIRKRRKSRKKGKKTKRVRFL